MSEALQIVEAVPAEQMRLERFADVAPVISIEQAIARHRQLSNFVSQVMKEGHDFGAIPGTGTKPTLLKPGAEKLTTLFGLTKRLCIVEKTEDWSGAAHEGEAFFYYLYRCALYRGDLLIAEADGSCNSRESKYRWREAQRKCPACGVAAIIKGRAEYGGGWVCFQKKSGCGSKFDDDDPAIISQQVGRIANPDVSDQVNTIQKMAAKRALVAATLLAVNASEFFTQDVEDFNHEPPPFVPTEPPTNNPPSKQHENQPTPAPAATPQGNTTRPAAPTNPLAKSVSELATPKQIVMIRAICRDLDIDVDLELSETLKLDCKVEELSRRAASSFIDHLKQIQEGNVLPVVQRSSVNPAAVVVNVAEPAPAQSSLPMSPIAQTLGTVAAQFNDRDAVIAEIKRIAGTMKFARNPGEWREFEKGLLGCPVDLASTEDLKTALAAITAASQNSAIIGWNSQAWFCSMFLQVYTIGLICAHAQVDGFEKTKALVGDPLLYRTMDRLDKTIDNLLSWVRPEELAARRQEKAA